MTVKHCLFSFLFLGLAYVGFENYWPRPATEAALAQQLAGSHCRFAYQIDHCEQRGFEPLRGLFSERHDCDMWAVKCLGDYKSPRAVIEMINVLLTKTDVETCDGVRPVRSFAVAYLGNRGDQSALVPLKKLLARKPNATLSAGASGCQPGLENTDAIRAAINKIEKRSLRTMGE